MNINTFSFAKTSFSCLHQSFIPQLSPLQKKVFAVVIVLFALLAAIVYLTRKLTVQYTDVGTKDYNGKLHGQGTRTYLNGDVVTGNFIHGELHDGTINRFNGNTETGIFYRGSLFKGSITKPDGMRDTGIFYKGKPCYLTEQMSMDCFSLYSSQTALSWSSFGTVTDKNIEEGYFIARWNNVLHGQGFRLCENGDIQKGEFANGILVNGTLTYADASIDEGTFQNGALVAGKHRLAPQMCTVVQDTTDPTGPGVIPDEWRVFP